MFGPFDAEMALNSDVGRVCFYQTTSTHCFSVWRWGDARSVTPGYGFAPCSSSRCFTRMEWRVAPAGLKDEADHGDRKEIRECWIAGERPVHHESSRVS